MLLSSYRTRSVPFTIQGVIFHRWILISGKHRRKRTTYKFINQVLKLPPPALQFFYLICFTFTFDLFLNQGSFSLLILRCYGVVVLSFMSMLLSTLINTQSKLRLKIVFTVLWQTDRQTDMFLFGVLYKESTLTTIPNS